MFRLGDFFISIGSYLISIIFIASFIDKITNWKIFKVKVEEYRIIPNRLIKPLSTIFMATDAYIGFMFLLKEIGLLNILLLVFILIVYTTAILINLFRGNIYISCGCGGVLESDKLSTLLVYRNIVLIILGISLLKMNDFLNINSDSYIVLPFLVSIAILLLYGVAKVFIEHNIMIRKLRARLVYFEE